MTQPTPQYPTIVFDLSADELSILMRFSGVPLYIGFEPLPLTDEVITSTASSLLARNMIEMKAARFEVNPIVAAIISAGAAHRYTLFVEKIIAEEPGASLWVYFAPGLTVAHRIDFTGHHFQTISDGMNLVGYLSAYMDINLAGDTQFAGAESQISFELWQNVMNFLKVGDKASAAALLVDNKADGTFAKDVAIVEQLQVFTMIQTQENDQAATHGGLVMSTQAGLWLIVPQQYSIGVASVNGRQIIDYIADLMPTA